MKTGQIINDIMQSVGNCWIVDCLDGRITGRNMKQSDIQKMI